MPVDEARFKRLAETPGVPGREEQVRRLVMAELAPLVDEVRVDALGNVIGTKRGRADVRVMIAAHMDEIGFLVRHIDERGFIRLQPLGGGMGALQMNAQRVLVHTESGASLRGALQLGRVLGPPQPGETPSLPRQDEFFVDLGLPAEAVRAAVLARCGAIRLDLLAEDGSEGFYERLPHRRKPGFRVYPAQYGDRPG